MANFVIPFKIHLGVGTRGCLRLLSSEIILLFHAWVLWVFVCRFIFLILNKTTMSSLYNPSRSIKKEQEYLPCTVNPVVINISGDSCCVFSKEEKSWEARTETEILPLKALLLPLIFMQDFCGSLHLRQSIFPWKSNTLSLSFQYRKAWAKWG